LYRLFVPPEPLINHRRPKEWTDAEAKMYFEWVLSVDEERIATLLRNLEMTFPSKGDEFAFLAEAGNRVVPWLLSAPNSAHEGARPVLTGQGSAVAADMGLLVARLLIRSYDKIRWILLKEPHDALSYNLPVLMGNIPRIYLDPLRGSITEARAIIQGRRNSTTVWADTFSAWPQKLLIP
jgi:hypothetical protein